MSAPALVFITGASSGIGQALALRFHRAGYRLALVARRVHEIETWAAAQQLPADSYSIYSADVSDTASIVAAAQDCLVRQGLPDVVIANAGISWGVDTSLREDLEVMQQVLASRPLRSRPRQIRPCAATPRSSPPPTPPRSPRRAAPAWSVWPSSGSSPSSTASGWRVL